MIWIYTILCIAESSEIASVDRPSVGTATYTIERGGIQLESGLQIDGAQGGSVYSLPTMLRIGLHDRVELRPYTSMLSHSDSDTLLLQSSGVQGKFKLYAPEDQNFAFSVLTASDINAGSGTVLLDAWKDNWSMWVNAGHSIAYESSTDSSLVLAGVCYALPQKQGVFVESSTTFSDSTTLTVEGGYTKAFTQLQVDVYALKNLSQANSWQIATGVGWKIR